MNLAKITDSGIKFQSFQEIRNSLQSAWRETFGEDIDLSPTSPDGHHIDLESRTIVSIAQLIQAVIANFNRDTAEGIWLDILASYQSIRRLRATYSRASVIFRGDFGTEIPKGTIVSYPGAPCDFVLESDILIGNADSVGICVATQIGKVPIHVGEWSFVSSAPAGASCSVESNDGEGRYEETDAELRKRMDDFSLSGKATYDAMLTYLRNCEGLEEVELEVNEEDDALPSGLPPHRFNVTVKGNVASNDYVAQKIWECKPAGIQSFGNLEGTAVDTAGRCHQVYFSRGQTVGFWARIGIVVYDEEILPTNYDAAINDALQEWARGEYVSGKDVLPKRLNSAIFKVPGIADTDIGVCIANSDPTPTTDPSAYKHEAIKIGIGDIAEFRGAIVYKISG